MAPSDLHPQSRKHSRLPEESLTSVADGRKPDSRLIELVAAGTQTFPASLSEGEAEQLGNSVSGVRRSRLIRWIAKCLADRLLRDRAQQKGQRT